MIFLFYISKPRAGKFYTTRTIPSHFPRRILFVLDFFAGPERAYDIRKTAGLQVVARPSRERRDFFCSTQYTTCTHVHSYQRYTGRAGSLTKLSYWQIINHEDSEARHSILKINCNFVVTSEWKSPCRHSHSHGHSRSCRRLVSYGMRWSVALLDGGEMAYHRLYSCTH